MHIYIPRLIQNYTHTHTHTHTHTYIYIYIYIHIYTLYEIYFMCLYKSSLKSSHVFTYDCNDHLNQIQRLLFVVINYIFLSCTDEHHCKNLIKYFSECVLQSYSFTLYIYIYIYIYIYMKVGWKVHRLTKILSWNVNKMRSNFQHISLGSPHCSSISVAVLGSHWSKKASTPDMMSAYIDIYSEIKKSFKKYHFINQKIAQYWPVNKWMFTSLWLSHSYPFHVLKIKNNQTATKGSWN